MLAAPLSASAQWASSPLLSRIEPEVGGGIAAGDGDGDGDPDLIIAVDGNVVWVETIGGEPGVVQELRDLTGPQRPDWWDVDGDGDLDIVYAVQNEGLWWHENVGTPTDRFAGGLLLVNHSATNPVWDRGDLDGDGDDDVVMGGASGSLVFLDTGGGTFATGSPLPGSSTLVQSVRLADLDADGDLDIVSSESETLALLNDGSGVFASSVPLDTDTFSAMRFCDIDSDGDLDWLRRFGNSYEYVPNTGGLVFFPPTVLGSSTDDQGLLCEDVVGGPEPDFVGVSATGLLISENLGGTLTSATHSAAHWSYGLSAVTDLDGDGLHEVISNAVWKQLVSEVVAVGGSAITMQTDWYFPHVEDYGGVAAGELDGEPGSDLGVLTLFPSEDFLVHRGPFATFARATQLDGSGGVPVARDIDGDGDMDLLTSGAHWYENGGSGIATTFVEGGGDIVEEDMDWGDLDADGDLDLIFLDGWTVYTKLNLGGGLLGSLVLHPYFSWPNPDEQYVGDFDGDGDADLMTRNGANLYIAQNDALDFFYYTNPLTGADDLLVSDVDNDGIDDILMLSSGTLEVAWGVAGFPTSSTPLFALQCDKMDLFDLDHDDLPELLCYSGDLAVYPNTGAGPVWFGPPETISLGSPMPQQLIPIDIDGDTDVDLLSVEGSELILYESPWVLDNDGDGSPETLDCDDTDPTIYPGAAETCDGIDNDCDGLSDEGLDDDGDGICNDVDLCFGDDAAGDLDGDGICDDGTDLCDGDDASGDADGDGYCASGVDGLPLDCDDNNASVSPGAPESCDGVDTDCDGSLAPDELDPDGDGVTACDGDCAPGVADAYPGATEQCDGIDSNCDGVLPLDETDVDGDGVSVCEGDCDDGEPLVGPGAEEICDGLDNDCDGVVDDDCSDPEKGCSGCATQGRAPLPWFALFMSFAVFRRR